MAASNYCALQLPPDSLRLLADASSLALVTEKSNAHSDYVWSVSFSPDGAKIVSGSSDKTIKVWGMRPVDESEWEEVDISAMEKDEDGEVEIDGLGYISENYWENTVTGHLEPRKPSGSENLRLEPGTIKAWDSGAFWASNCLSFA